MMMTDDATREPRKPKRQRGVFHRLTGAADLGAIQETARGDGRGRVLVLLVLSGIFAPFLTPYDPTIAGRDKDYQNGAPQSRSSAMKRLFSRALSSTRSNANARSRPISLGDHSRRDKRLHVSFLSRVDIQAVRHGISTHLFGVEKGKIHLFGTDCNGKDIFSRTFHAINTSLQWAPSACCIAFVLALIIGGISGYYGGWIDSLSRWSRTRCEPCRRSRCSWRWLPSFPRHGVRRRGFSIISIILGFIGWPTLARRVRTHLLTERNQEYVLAAQLVRASPGHVIRRHLLPSFTSYIIVDLVISFPYMVLSETALSFIGLGLKDPVNSLGVMLQNVTRPMFCSTISGISFR